MMSCRQIVTSMSFFKFMANLHPSGRRLPDAWSIKPKFSLTITFHLAEPENSYFIIALNQDTISAKKR